MVKTISGLVPQGSVSVEVYAEASTPADAMLRQGKEIFPWIPIAHVKFPTSREGLKAAERAVKEGLRVNMTLCFSQEQAAAVYAATRGAKRGQVFEKKWEDCDIRHELTDKGMERFSADWNALIKSGK